MIEHIIVPISRSFLRAIGSLPLRILTFFAQLLYWIGFKVFGYRNGVIYQNLSRSFPELDYNQITKIAHRNMQFIAQLPFVWLKLMTLKPKTVADKLALTDYNQGLASISNDNKNHILVSGHFDNWELFCLLPLLVNKPVYAVYKRQSSSFSDKITRSWRERFGLQLLEMKMSAKFMIENKHQPSIYILIGDQRPVYKKDKITFLNQNTYVMNGLDRLQAKLNAGVHYLEINEVDFKEITFKVTEIDSETSVNHNFYQLLEKSIRQKPEKWLWTHKRWKPITS